MYRISAFCLLFFCFLWACKNPLDGFELRFKKPFPVALDVQYYTKGGLEVPTESQVLITGPDAGRVITTVETKKFRLTGDGTLFLSIDSLGPRPSEQQPLRFTVVVKSRGALDAVLPVELRDDKQRSVTLVFQPQEAVNTKVNVSQRSSSSVGRIDADWVLETPELVGTAQSKVKATVSQGSIVKDAVGKEIAGTLTARFQVVDITKPHDNFLINPIINSTIARPLLKDGSGVGSNQQFTQLAGAFLLQIYNEQFRLVKSLTSPIKVRFSVSSQLYHPQERRLIKEGDEIPLYSYDAATNTWQTEVFGKVVKVTDGSLSYEAELPHLSLWVAGFTKQKCETGPSFKIKSSLPATDVQYQCEVLADGTNTRLQVFKSTINNGEVIRVNGLESDQYVRLRITDALGSATVTSEVINGCGGTEQVLDVSSFKKQIIKCTTGPGFQIKSNLPPSDYRYNCVVINAETNATLQSFQTTANNGEVIRLNGLDSDQKIRVKISDIVSGAVAISESVDACATSVQPLDISSFKLPPQRCTASPIFKIQSTLPASDRTYTFEVIKPDSKNRLQVFQSTANNGDFIRLNGLYDNTGSIQLRIFDIVSATVATSAVVEACSNITYLLILEGFQTPAPRCASTLNFRIKSSLPNSSHQYTFEVINAKTNGTMQKFQSTANNGDIVRINGLYSDETVRLRITDLFSTATVQSVGLAACTTNTQEIDLTSFKAPPTKCATPLTFTVKSSLPVSDRVYDCELLNATTNAIMRSFQSKISSGSSIKISNLESGAQVKLKVYDNQSSAIGISSAVDPCSATAQTIDLSAFKVPSSLQSGEVRITLQFPCKALDEPKLPTRELFGRFRETGTLQWKNLPSMKYISGQTSFSIVTDLLVVGKTYDFQVGPAPGYYSFSENAYTLRKADWVIRIDTDEYCKK